MFIKRCFCFSQWTSRSSPNLVGQVVKQLVISFRNMHYSDVIMIAMASQINQGLVCLLNHLFRRRSKNTSKRRVTGLCEGNPPVNGEFSSRNASNAENVSSWWRHHGEPFMLTRVLCALPHVNTFWTTWIAEPIWLEKYKYILYL